MKVITKMSYGMLTYNSQNATVQTLIFCFNCLLSCNLSCEHLNRIYISYEKAKAQVLLHPPHPLSQTNPSSALGPDRFGMLS